MVDAYRDLVEGIATRGAYPETTPEEMRSARDMLSALFGPIRVEPRGGSLVAKVSVTGARLAAAGQAPINPSFMAAGAGWPLSAGSAGLDSDLRRCAAYRCKSFSISKRKWAAAARIELLQKIIR